MTAKSESTFDVFVSHNLADRPWVEQELLPRLAEAGLKVCLSYRDFEIGTPTLVNTERAIDRSRHTLIVLTPAWLEDEWNEFEGLLTSGSDPAGRRRRLIPLLLRPCPLPARISLLTAADFTDPAQHAAEMARLVRGLRTKSQVFISYKRNVEPDEPLTMRLRKTLTAAGHRIFLDQQLTVGVEWAKTIYRQIEASDFVLVLLSAASVQSEMVAAEVAHAQQHFQKTGKARLIPIRVNFADALPYQLSHALDSLQYAAWQNMDDDERLFKQLLDAISELAALASPAEQSSIETQPPDVRVPPPVADPRFLETLAAPGGNLRPKDKFYISRASDDLLLRELNKPLGTTTTIRAPRQTGKSSLLIRGIAQAQQQHSKVVYFDLEMLEETYTQNLDEFLRYLATVIVTKLRLDPAEVDKAWQGRLGAPDKLTYLMEDYVLLAANAQIVLALDEVDRLLAAPFQDTFFGLLRFWHNNRAINELWEKLDIVLVISTEPHLLVSDVNQSPFNVGQKIRLQDFDAVQVGELNLRYRSPLAASEISAVMTFLNGHPYLTHKALYTMVTEPLTWPQLLQSATTEQSPFGDHLRHTVWLLRDQPQLREALKQILRKGECPDDALFYRLSQAGLVQGPSRSSCRLRCKLYEEYLRDKL